MSNCKTCCGTDTQKQHTHSHEHGHDHDHEHNHETGNFGLIFSFILFGIGLVLQYIIKPDWFINNNLVQFILFGIAYIPVAYPVLINAFELLKKKDFFNEFSLMEYAETVINGSWQNDLLLWM